MALEVSCAASLALASSAGLLLAHQACAAPSSQAVGWAEWTDRQAGRESVVSHTLGLVGRADSVGASDLPPVAPWALPSVLLLTANSRLLPIRLFIARPSTQVRGDAPPASGQACQMPPPQPPLSPHPLLSAQGGSEAPCRPLFASLGCEALGQDSCPDLLVQPSQSRSSGRRVQARGSCLSTSISPGCGPGAHLCKDPPSPPMSASPLPSPASPWGDVHYSGQDCIPHSILRGEL